MFQSLLEWCKFPVFVHSYSGMSGTGDYNYADPVKHMCYREDASIAITDKLGKEYISRARVYFKPDAIVKEEDTLSFPDDPIPREIRKLGGYYDGNTGKLDIRIAYL